MLKFAKRKVKNTKILCSVLFLTFSWQDVSQFWILQKLYNCENHWNNIEKYIFCSSPFKCTSKVGSVTLSGSTAAGDTTLVDFKSCPSKSIEIIKQMANEDLINPLTFMIWLIILPTSCNTFPCKLVTRIWCWIKITTRLVWVFSLPVCWIMS